MSQKDPIADSTLRTCGGILYAEHETGNANFGASDQEIVRILSCRWSDSRQFLNDMLPTCGICNGQGRGCGPDQHPVYSHLYCMECKLMKGLGAPVGDGPVKYRDVVNDVEGGAMYSCYYRSLPYDVGSGGPLDIFIDKTKAYSAETLTIPGNTYFWADANGTPLVGPNGGNLPLEAQRGIIQPLGAIHYRQMYRPDDRGDLDKLVSQYLGTINDSLFDTRYEPKTLLLLAPDTQRARDVAGNICLHVDFVFALRDGPDNPNWNKFWRPSDKGYVNVTPDVYKQKDFSKLFVPCAQP